MKLLTDFNWDVHRAGYEWADDDAPRPRTPPSPVLKPVPGRSAPVHRYAPLAHKALFRAFAHLDGQHETLIKFANRYGLLIGKTVRLPNRDEDVLPFTNAARRPAMGDRPPARFLADSYDFWCEQVVAMRQAVSVWDMVQEGDASGLERNIRWRQDYEGRFSAVYDSHPDVNPDVDIEPPDHRRQVSLWSMTADEMAREGLDPEDLVFPAREFIRQAISHRLQGLAIPQVGWNPDRTGLMLHLQPRNLLGCLWLQFAEAVAQDKKYRRCRECSKQFEVNSMERTERHFCSTACRSKAYRQRQNEARKCHIEGLSFDEIAKVMDTDLKTVKGWITGTRE